MTSRGHAYRVALLPAFESHGLRPRTTTDPVSVRRQINDLYVFELRRLKAQRRELEVALGPQPLEPYGTKVRALRRRYSLLALPLESWLES